LPPIGTFVFVGCGMPGVTFTKNRIDQGVKNGPVGG
jgi:hypothetical protein